MRKIYLIFSIICLFFAVTPVGFAFTAEKYDLIITNARIIDGTGNPWFYGSIGVKDGKIIKIGQFEANDAEQIIDAKNNIVAPGFIDVHAHTESIYKSPKAENFIRMGVTSVITGNCGGSVINTGKFLDRIKDEPLAINIGTLIAHGSVREEVLGLGDRQPTPEEQAKMNAIVERAMKEGAVGLSTGLIYVPGTYAKTEEVIELAKIAAKYKGVYASHIRNEGEKVVEAINEAINIGEKANLPVEISHFKISSKNLWGESDKTIGLVKAARERGTQVTIDQYAYTASSTSLDARLPGWAIAGGREEGIKRIENPETRKKIIEDLKKNLKSKGFKDFSFAYVASYNPNPAFNGKNIAEITKMARGTKKLNAQIDQIFEMYKTGRVQMVYRMMDENDVQNIMRQPFTMIAADSGVREFGEGVPHPRGYGNNARVLGRYVRELKIISLEDAIRKMTSLPAQTFRLNDRGLLKEGFAADIVIFDEKTITDKATFENPHQYAEGFQAVIVNGKMVFDGSKMTDAMPGQALYGSGAE
ncbi:MAG: N-acyl-D-amino-acid deacylase family protein [Aridibacter sp.]